MAYTTSDPEQVLATSIIHVLQKKKPKEKESHLLSHEMIELE